MLRRKAGKAALRAGVRSMIFMHKRFVVWDVDSGL